MALGEANVGVMWPARRVRVIIWCIYICAWSTALLVPKPSPPFEVLRSPEAEFVFAKILHISAYALLAILTCWLRLPGRWAWVFLGFLFAHGVVTECLQACFTSLGRTGCIEDVIRDWIGITLGLAVSWFPGLVKGMRSRRGDGAIAPHVPAESPGDSR
jgi:VanZ family protein